MPKYYVSSGNLKEIVTRDTALEAAVVAAQHAHNRAIAEHTEMPALGIIMGVNEQGFENVDDDTWILTTTVLEEAGLTSEYSFCGANIKDLKEMLSIFELYTFLEQLREDDDDNELDLDDDD